MTTIHNNEEQRKIRRSNKRRRRSVSLVCCALLAVAAGTMGEVAAFGTSSCATPTARIQTALHMKPESSSPSSSSSKNSSPTPSYQRSKKPTRATISADLISRKAALVDSSHLEPPTSAGKGLRDRVNSFLRSKKKRSKIVQEVKDIDSIYSVLGEGQKEAVYTAVIFHAPYCRACKASMPLFEALAKQYNRRNKKYAKQRKSRWGSSNNNNSYLQSSETARKQPVVRFLSVPVTQDNSKELQERFAVTKFPLAHIYDPFEGLIDERPVLRKLFSAFERRLESVVVESSSTEESTPSEPTSSFSSSSSSESIAEVSSSPMVARSKNVTMA